MKWLWLALLLGGCGNASEAGGDASNDNQTVSFVARDSAALQAAPHWSVTALEESGCQGTGGLCAADFDGDGNVDLAMARAGLAPILFWGDGAFGWTPQELGPAMVATGCFAADLDGDGSTDLLLTAMTTPGNRFYRNRGARTFSEEAVSRGLDLASSGDPGCLGFRSVSAADLDRDGDLDLYISRWDELLPGRLLRNDGSGHFSDITESAGLGGATYFGYSSAFGDLDRDGRTDLLIAGDFSTTQVFAGTETGFVNTSRAWGMSSRENGMGSLLFDPDGDGDLDALVTGILGDPIVCGANAPLCDGNRLYLNNLPQRSERVEQQYGLAAGSWGWGMALLDADNDGDEDIVQTNGFSIPAEWDAPEESFPELNPYVSDPILFFERDGVGFEERAAARGLADNGEGRTALAVDVDDDGDLDLALSHSRAPVEVWETVAPSGRGWLKVWVLDQNCELAVGAKVELQTSSGRQRRWVQANSSFLGNDLSPLHFGLGAATPLRLTVVWLDGTITSVGVSSRNSRLTLTPAGISCP